jgi:hypothetical protein
MSDKVHSRKKMSPNLREHPNYSYISAVRFVRLSDYDALQARLSAAEGELRQKHETIDRMLGYHVEDERRIATLEALLRRVKTEWLDRWPIDSPLNRDIDAALKP